MLLFVSKTFGMRVRKEKNKISLPIIDKLQMILNQKKGKESVRKVKVTAFFPFKRLVDKLLVVNLVTKTGIVLFFLL